MSKKEEKKKKINTGDLVTKESFCAVGALFSALAFFILCTNEAIFGAGIGGTIHDFLIGVFGLCAFPIMLATLYLSVTGLIGKRFVKNRRTFGFGVCAFFALALIIHTAATYSWAVEGYLSKCFYAPTDNMLSPENATVTVAGWLGGVVVYLLSIATTKVGAIIILSAFVLFFAYLAYFTWKNHASSKVKDLQKKVDEQFASPVEIPLTAPVTPTPVATQQGYTPYTATAPTATQQTQQAQQAQQAPTYPQGYGTVSAPQQPAFILSDETGEAQPSPVQSNIGRVYSPFGSAAAKQEENDGLQKSYEDGRANLFDFTPAESYKRNLIFDPNARVNTRGQTPTNGANVGYTPSYTESYQNAVNSAPERPEKIFTDRSKENVQPYSLRDESELTPPRAVEPPKPAYTYEEPTRVDEPVYGRETLDEPRQTLDVSEREVSLIREDTYRRHESMDLFSPSNPNVFGNDDASRRMAEETFSSRDRGDAFEDARDRDFRVEPLFDETPRMDTRDSERDGINIFDEDENDIYTLRDDYTASRVEERVEEPREAASRYDDFLLTDRSADRFDDFAGNERVPVDEPRVESTPTPAVVPPTPAPAPAPEPKPEPPKPRVIRPYVKPRLDDFDCRDVEPTKDFAEVEETKQTIIATLEDFKVMGASIATTTFGPTVTRYNVTIPRNISPKKVVALDQPIAISLHSSGVNIYPNYEDGVVSIEVPNKERQFVQLGCMLSGDTFVNAKSSSIMFAMGKDAGNRKVYGDISKMIHMLVAGSSGSGKSVFLGSLIISLIYKYSPEELRLILIDPKKTEFVLYNDLPHLMINEIITDANKAVQSLNWAIGEMNRRYGLFEQMSRAGTYVVNLDQYNSHLEKSERLPKIVIIIDELADLMLAAKKDIEDRIQNLTQKARAAGIHLVVATQRPSTDVITGVIKSNLPTRIAFAVATDVDSRVILDQTGAQKLLGKGDFLYTMQGINTPVRVQSAFISAEDSQRIVNYIKTNNEAYYDESATAYINNTRSGGGGGNDSFGSGDEIEPVYIEALRCVILSSSASISLIQRKCSIGYNKAGRIVEWMEEMGYISSFEGAKARKVLITKEEFESKYGPL